LLVFWALSANRRAITASSCFKLEVFGVSVQGKRK
jgi:hypothetical protein